MHEYPGETALVEPTHELPTAPSLCCNYMYPGIGVTHGVTHVMCDKIQLLLDLHVHSSG